MTEKDKLFVESWEKTISKGKMYFVILYTVSFTIFASFIAILVKFLINMEFTKQHFIAMFTLKNILVNILGMFVAGLIMAFYTWSNSNKKYNQLKIDNE